MELPYNTTISGDLLKGGGQFADPVAGWAAKRRWVQDAFAALERAGYHVGSAYRGQGVREDQVRLSRSAVGGRGPAGARRRVVRPHQRRARAERGAGRSTRPPSSATRIPLGRAYRLTDEERLIREFVLQLKRGAIRPSCFAENAASTSSIVSAPRWRRCGDGYLADLSADRIALTREGLMRVDVLLPRFFLPDMRHPVY